MRQRILLAVALVALAGAAAAQTPFSLTNLGQDITTSDVRDTGRGGWGVADIDTLTPGFANPAAVADTRLALFLFSGMGLSASSEGDDGERKTFRTILPEVRLALPLRDGRLAIHAGFHVRRSLQYRTLRDATWESAGETVTGQERFVREGTLYEIPVGLSWRLRPRVAVSASVNLVRGSVDEELAQFYQEGQSGPRYFSTIRSQTDELSGTSATFGLLVGPLGPLSLGAVYTTAHDLEMKREVDLQGVGGGGSAQYTLSMPEQIRAGMRLKLGGPWRFGCDGELARYSELAGYAPWQRDARDEWLVAAGFEKALTRSARGGRTSPPLRIGVSWRRWAYEVGGEPVDERTVSVGTGFPFQGKLGMIDLALSYSLIGDRDQNGYRSEVWRLGVSVIGLEKLLF